MSVEIWLTFNKNSEKLQLPVNPSQLGMKAGSANESVSVQRLGEVTIIQDPVLKTFDFSSQFPKYHAPFCEYTDIPDPREAVAMIERWKESGYPIRFMVINDDGIEWNYLVTIESFQPREDAGDVGTIYYDLSLKEYKFIKVRTTETKTENGETYARVNQKGNRPNEKMKPKSYNVKSGDNLYLIGKSVGVDYLKIAQANKIKPPYTIYPNQVLIIP